MIILLLRGTRNQGRISTPGLVSRAAAGDPLELLGVLHSTKRVVVKVAPLLIMMTLRITEFSTGRERALTESQMMIVQMMMRRRHV